MDFFFQNEGSKSSSGRRKQPCPSKAPTDKSHTNEVHATIKKPTNDTKLDLSNAKAWANNVDSKVCLFYHSYLLTYLSLTHEIQIFERFLTKFKLHFLFFKTIAKISTN